MGLTAFGSAALRAAGLAFATSFLLLLAAGLAADFLAALTGFATFLATFFAVGFAAGFVALTAFTKGLASVLPACLRSRSVRLLTRAVRSERSSRLGTPKRFKAR